MMSTGSVLLKFVLKIPSYQLLTSDMAIGCDAAGQLGYCLHSNLCGCFVVLLSMVVLCDID